MITIELIENLLTHPIETGGKIYDAFKFVSAKVSKAVVFAITNSPFETAEKADEFVNGILNKLDKMPSTEIGEGLGYILTDLACGYCTGLYAGKALTITKEALPLAIANGAEKLKAFGVASKEIAKTIGLSAKNGTTNVINGIDYYITQPNLFKSEGTISKAIEKASKKAQIFSNYLGDMQESFNTKTSSIYNNLPEYFIPPDGKIITWTNDKIQKFTDKFGNTWETSKYSSLKMQTLSGYMIHCSDIEGNPIRCIIPKEVSEKITSGLLAKEIGFPLCSRKQFIELGQDTN